MGRDCCWLLSIYLWLGFPVIFFAGKWDGYPDHRGPAHNATNGSYILWAKFTRTQRVPHIHALWRPSGAIFAALSSLGGWGWESDRDSSLCLRGLFKK